MVDPAIGINLDALHAGLKSVRLLRSTVLEVFKFMSDGAPSAYGDAEREKFIDEVQGTLTNVRVRMRELETACTLLGSPSPPLSLGYSGLLSQDPAYEKTPLYSELIKAHRWFDKMYELSSHAYSIFNQNSLKRAPFNPVPYSNKQPMRMKPTGHNLPVPNIDHAAAQLNRMFPDVQVEMMRPYGSSTVLLISVGRTLKSLILLRGLIIDWVVVKAFHEDFYCENKKLDIWSQSRYLVFQKVTDHCYSAMCHLSSSNLPELRVTEHCNSAMLHFYSPNLPDLAVRSYLTWLRSYNTLFTAPCRKCGNRLHNSMPPTWRDVRNLDVYHDSCKP